VVKIFRVSVPTEKGNPMRVWAVSFNRVPGLAITQGVRWRDASQKSYCVSNEWAVTHLASGRAVIGIITGLWRAWRALNALNHTGTDWTLDMGAVLALPGKELRQEQLLAIRERYELIEWAFEEW